MKRRGRSETYITIETAIVGERWVPQTGFGLAENKARAEACLEAYCIGFMISIE
jgi:hypothetical protein